MNHRVTGEFRNALSSPSLKLPPVHFSSTLMMSASFYSFCWYDFLVLMTPAFKSHFVQLLRTPFYLLGSMLRDS